MLIYIYNNDQIKKIIFFPVLDKDSWQEMVKETVPQTESAFDLQMELIFNCSCNRDNAEAVYWADYFNIPHSKLPPLVKEYIRQRYRTRRVI